MLTFVLKSKQYYYVCYLFHPYQYNYMYLYITEIFLLNSKKRVKITNNYIDGFL